MGAITQLQKPVSREQWADAFDDIEAFVHAASSAPRREDDEGAAHAHRRLIARHVGTTAVDSGEEALAALGAEQFDCMVSTSSCRTARLELIERIQNEQGHTEMTLIVYTGKD